MASFKSLILIVAITLTRFFGKSGILIKKSGKNQLLNFTVNWFFLRILPIFLRWITSFYPKGAVARKSILKRTKINF